MSCKGQPSGHPWHFARWCIHRANQVNFHICLSAMEKSNTDSIWHPTHSGGNKYHVDLSRSPWKMHPKFVTSSIIQPTKATKYKKKQVDKIWEADSGGVSSFVSLVSTGPNLRLHQSFVQTQGRLATWTQPKLGGIHPWNLCTWCFPWLNMVSKQVDQTSTNQI